MNAGNCLRAKEESSSNALRTRTLMMTMAHSITEIYCSPQKNRNIFLCPRILCFSAVALFFSSLKYAGYRDIFLGGQKWERDYYLGRKPNGGYIEAKRSFIS